MSISKANDDSIKANPLPTVEEMYSNLKDNEIILSWGCGFGRCIGLPVTLDIESGYSRCPFCGNGRALSKEDIIDILENENYNKNLTKTVWKERKENNLLALKEKLRQYKNM